MVFHGEQVVEGRFGVPRHDAGVGVGVRLHAKAAGGMGGWTGEEQVVGSAPGIRHRHRVNRVVHDLADTFAATHVRM
jgi:hypothetical protein